MQKQPEHSELTELIAQTKNTRPVVLRKQNRSAVGPIGVSKSQLDCDFRFRSGSRDGQGWGCPTCLQNT